MNPVLLPLLWSCATQTDVPPEGPRSDDTGTLPSQRYTSDWEGVLQLIDERCRTCHQPGGGAHMMLPEALMDDLDNDLGVLVVPGDPDASMLWRLVADELWPGDWGIMPLGNLLPPEDTVHLRVWINAGAPR